MPRKVFISFLGFSDYAPCHYCYGDYKSAEVKYVQEATLDYLTKASEWKEDDCALILLTQGAEAANWVDEGHRDRYTGEIKKGSGLRTRLEGMNLPLQIKPVKNLPDGNDESEIWKIFSRVFDELHDGDELYFDLTHGFRYLPMLVLVLGNYAKFLKNVTVRHLSYGNYEGRNKATNEALLVDLSPLSSLQDWTFAAASFIQSGNVDRLLSLSEDTYNPLLKESRGKDESAKALRDFTGCLKSCVEDFQTCRGLNIIGGQNVSSLKLSIEALNDNVIEPLTPVVQHIQTSIAPFYTDENIANGFHAAEWCLNNGLYQQAATILQENVISFFACRNDIALDDEKGRHLINEAFTIQFYALQEKDWKVADEDKGKVREILSDTLMNDKSIICSFNNLSEVRNDINHSGMRSKRQPLSAKSIKKNINKCVDFFKLLFIQQ